MIPSGGAGHFVCPNLSHSDTYYTVNVTGHFVCPNLSHRDTYYTVNVTGQNYIRATFVAFKKRFDESTKKHLE